MLDVSSLNSCRCPGTSHHQVISSHDKMQCLLTQQGHQHLITGPDTQDITWLNWLTPGKFELNFKYVIFMVILIVDGGGIFHEIALRWLPLNFNDKSTLVQLMAWCHQATSHYLNQCWPRSLPPYGLTRPQLEQLERLRSEIPPAAPWLPILVIHIRSQVKIRQSQSYIFKKIAKNEDFEILLETLHVPHPLKLLGKMYKYDMDPTRNVEQSRHVMRDRQMDGGSETNISPDNFVVWGYNELINWTNVYLFSEVFSGNHMWAISQEVLMNLNP